jgi:hypothetical protein
MSLPAFWHRLWGASVFAVPPEVSAIAATSGYCLSTLRVEKTAHVKNLPTARRLRWWFPTRRSSWSS